MVKLTKSWVSMSCGSGCRSDQQVGVVARDVVGQEQHRYGDGIVRDSPIVHSVECNRLDVVGRGCPVDGARFVRAAANGDWQMQGRTAASAEGAQCRGDAVQLELVLCGAANSQSQRHEGGEQIGRFHLRLQHWVCPVAGHFGRRDKPEWSKGRRFGDVHQDGRCTFLS